MIKLIITPLEKVGVASIVEKMVENMLMWFGHVERRHVDVVVREINQIGRVRSKEIEEDLEKL